jgi:hypothetical protein
MNIIKQIKSKLKYFLTLFIIKFFNYKLLEEPGSFQIINKKKLQNLFNKYNGETCFILGNGPSLNEVDFTKFEGKYTFGVNSIFYKTKELGFSPYFYTVEDIHVFRDNLSEIKKIESPYQFFPSIYKRRLSTKSNYYYFNMNRGFYEKNSPNFERPRFSYDISDKIYCGQSVTIINLQIAFYLGFKSAILIGMDFDYVVPKGFIVDGNSILSTGDDPNHFHHEYFGKGKKWHDPKLDNVLKNYKLAKTVYEIDGREIINATSGGKLEVFRREDFNKIL